MDATFTFELDEQLSITFVVRNYGPLSAAELARCGMFEFKLAAQINQPETVIVPATRLVNAMSFTEYTLRDNDNEALYVTFLSGV